MLFIENMYTINIIIIIIIIKDVWLTTVVKEARVWTFSPSSCLCSSPLCVSLEYNDHQIHLMGIQGGDRCRCCSSFALFGQGKCWVGAPISLQPLQLKP